MSRLPSVMTHQFSQVPRAEIPRSSFDRSHGLKTTFNAGLLVPIFVDEALPGDTFNLRMTAFARMATPVYPVMDNLYLDTFFFAVPLRLVWDNFKRFMGEQPTVGASTDFLIPTMSVNGPVETGDMGDYFGIPIGLNYNQVNPSALPFRAYNLIWNEWFRDQNLQDPRPVPKGDGPDTTAGQYTIRRRGKRHDYFTSCLPWPQKGTAVALPLGTAATVRTTNEELVDGAQTPMRLTRDTGAAFSGVNQLVGSISTGPGSSLGAYPSSTGSGTPQGAYPSNLYADLSDATAATINQLRQAFQIQKLFERDARGGTRYTEVVRAHFGVTSPDARLQRPEYLGGGSTPVNISPVAQTSSTDATSPQGNLSAFGTVTAHGHGFTKSFTEHCIIIGLASVRADLTYQQGLERMWSRRTRFDFYWPALAHIGEQAVLSKEIYADGTSDDNNVFGYQERYAEYRYKPSRITGKFRSVASGSLDVWHLSQHFETRPVLGATFMQDIPPVARVVATPEEPHFLFDSYFQFRCARPMPLYGVPGFTDRF